MLLILKAILPKSGTSDLFAQTVEVGGYHTKHGTYVAPHLATRRKKREDEGGRSSVAPAAAKPAPAIAATQSELFASPAKATAIHTAAEPAPAAKAVPELILAHVRRAINVLSNAADSVRQGRAADEKSGVVGRHEADAFANVAGEIQEGVATLTKFRAACAKNGTASEAVIASLGGVPNLQPSAAARAWMEGKRERPPAADSPQEGDRQVVNGVDSVLQDGRWHAAVNADDPAASLPADPIAADWPLVEHVTKRGKTLQGAIRTDLTRAQALAIDPYTFAKDGGFFIRQKHLDGTAATVAEPAPNTPQEATKGVAELAAAEDTRRQRQAEKLRANAEVLGSDAQEDLNRDRQSNTARRARMAAGAIDDAAGRLRIAETMHALADAIERGEGRMLSKVDSRAAVETLDHALRQGMYATDRHESYIDRERKKGRAPTPDDIRNARIPSVYVHPSVARELVEALTGGMARGRTAVLAWLRSRASGPDDVVGRVDPSRIEALRDACQVLVKKGGAGSYAAKRILGEVREVDRLKRMGIETDLDLQRALAEYVIHRGGSKSEDPIKCMERELHQYSGNDFFPTPPALVDQLVREADIEPGMKVLEPSAGKGDIADALRTSGADVHTIEIGTPLRAILEAKGHKLVGTDFLEHQAPDGGYDRIVMNPPFSDGQDAAHVQRAYEMLKPGGRLVAITGEGVHFRQDKAAQAFRGWLAEHGGSAVKLPEGSFKSAFRRTGVATRMVVVDKPAGAAPAPASAPLPASEVDLPAIAAAPEAPTAYAAPGDIDFERAVDAHRWNSMSPEARGRQVQEDYVAHVHGVRDDLMPIAQTPEQRVVLDDGLRRYAAGYRDRVHAALGARSRTASVAVTGPARFNTAANEKARGTERRRSEEADAWSKKAITALREKIKDARTDAQVVDDQFAQHRRALDSDMATARLIDAGDARFRGLDRSAFVNSAAGRLRTLSRLGHHEVVGRLLDHARERQAGAEKPFFSDRNPAWKLERPLAKALTADGFDTAARDAFTASGDAVGPDAVAARMGDVAPDDILDMVHARPADYAMMPDGEHFAPMDAYMRHGDADQAAQAATMAEQDGGVPPHVLERLQDQARRLSAAATAR